MSTGENAVRALEGIIYEADTWSNLEDSSKGRIAQMVGDAKKYVEECSQNVEIRDRTIARQAQETAELRRQLAILEDIVGDLREGLKKYEEFKAS